MVIKSKYWRSVYSPFDNFVLLYIAGEDGKVPTDEDIIRNWPQYRDQGKVWVVMGERQPEELGKGDCALYKEFDGVVVAVVNPATEDEIYLVRHLEKVYQLAKDKWLEFFDTFQKAGWDVSKIWPR